MSDVLMSDVLTPDEDAVDHGDKIIGVDGEFAVEALRPAEVSISDHLTETEGESKYSSL